MYRLPFLARQVASVRLLPISRNTVAVTMGPKATLATVATRAAVETFARRLSPMLDRVIVQKAEAITRTKGGLVIPEKAQGKILEGVIVAVGPGARNDKGQNIPVGVSVGDTVILPEYGGTKVEIDDNELFIYREHDILAILKKD